MTYSKLRFSELKKFVSRSVFGEILLNSQTSCCILKSWEQNCVWIFYYFNFERNYDVLKSKNLCFLLYKNINFNRNEMESKVENPTYTFRLMNLVLERI